MAFAVTFYANRVKCSGLAIVILCLFKKTKVMISEDRNNQSEENRNREYTSSNNDQQFHNQNMRQQDDFQEDDQAETNVQRAKSENDDYSNTGTGANYSASDRKEKLTDENYGMSGQYTRKDIINDFENSDNEEETSN